MPIIYQDSPPAVTHNVLFSEQDIEEEANAATIDIASQDQFLPEVKIAVATAKNTGPPILTMGESQTLGFPSV